MSTNNELIISPPFTDSNWNLSDTCSIISKDDYSCVFNTSIIESGMSFKIPNSWHGKTVTISFEMSDNACIRIQNTDTREIICELSEGNSPFTLVIPNSEMQPNMVLAIVSPTVANTIISINSFKITTTDLTKHINFAGMDIANFYIGDIEIKKIYLKDTLIYENIKVVDINEMLYNEFTSTLFILKENALSYDENELNLIVNSDVIEVNYDNENLNIGGDSE